MHRTGPALVSSSTIPWCLHWGFALPLPLAKDRPGGESSRGRALRSQSCVLPALAGAAPPASAHWLMVPLGINYAFLTRGYSNGKIVYLQLGELKAEAEEQVAPPCHGRPPAPFSLLPQAQPGMDPAASILAFPAWGDPWFPSPTQPLSAPFSQGNGCLPSAWPQQRGGEDSTYFTLC